MSAPRGCLLLGGGIPACTEADPPPWTESQMPVKTLPCPNFVAGGKDLVQLSPWNGSKKFPMRPHLVRDRVRVAM